MLKGNNLILSINGTPLGASRSCSIDRNTDTIEKCSPVDGPARSFIPSTTSWSISAGGLYANTAGAERLRSIWRKQQRGEQTPLRIGLTLDGKPEQGEAILTSLQETGNIGELVKFSISLQGTGLLYSISETIQTVMFMQHRVLSIRSDYVVFTEDTAGDAVFADLQLDADSVIRIDCGGAAQKWVICRGTKDGYEQDVELEHDIDSSQYIARGTGDATVTVSTPGQYCILSDNSSNPPLVSVLQ